MVGNSDSEKQSQTYNAGLESDIQLEIEELDQGFAEQIFQPLKIDEEQSKCGWNKATIEYYSEHAQKIKRMIFSSAKMFNRPQLQKQDVDDIYSELGSFLYKNDDYDFNKAYNDDTGSVAPIEVYINYCVKTCVQKFCQHKQSMDKHEQHEKIFEDSDGKQCSQFDFVEDNSVRTEFFRLDYDLRQLCEQSECHRYDFGCDMFQLIYVRLLLISEGRHQDDRLYDSIMTVLGVNKKELMAVNRHQQKSDIFIQILKAANEIGFKNAVVVLEDFVYGVKYIKEAVRYQY